MLKVISTLYENGMCLIKKDLIVPGWVIMGVIQDESGEGALVRNTSGQYLKVCAGNITTLPAREVLEAFRDASILFEKNIRSKIGSFFIDKSSNTK